MFTLTDALKEILQKALPQPQNAGIGPTLANQQQIAQPQPQPMAQQAPVQPQGQMLAMPNMGPPSNQGGGGFANTLGNMGKSFLNTAAETIPVALANYALFGGGQMGQRMTYASMVNQLDEKRKKEEERKQDRQAAFASYLYSVKKYGGKFGISSEDVENAVIGGALTGNQEFDAQIKQHHETIAPMIKSGDLDATTLWNARLSASEYEKAMKPEGLLPPETVKQREEIFEKEKKIEKKYKEPKYEVKPEDVVAQELDIEEKKKKLEAKYREPKEVTTSKIEAGIIVKFLSGENLTPQEEQIKGKYFKGDKDTAEETKKRWKAKVEAFEEVIGRKATIEEKRRMFIADPYGMLAPDKTSEQKDKYSIGEKYNGKTIVAVGRDGNTGEIVQIKLEDGSIVEVK